MDPLSITASIIAVLQVTKELIDYLNDVKDASEGQKEIIKEAGNTYVFLQNIKNRIESANEEEPWFDRARSLDAPGGPLEQLKGILNKIVERIRGRNQVERAIKWPFTKKEIQENLERIERLKSSIAAALSSDHFTLSLKTENDVSTMKQELTFGHQAELSNKLFRWLQVPDPSSNYNAARKARQSGTNSWLLNGPEFLKWRSDPGSSLWLHGIPGCGKTVLSAAALEKLKELYGSSSTTLIAFFYFDFNDTGKQRMQNMLRSFLYQLSFQHPTGRTALLKSYANSQDGQSQPDDGDLQVILHQILEASERTYLIVDALDECDSENRNELLALITTLIDRHKSSLSILVTSRLLLEIQEALNPVTHQIAIQSEVVDQDIRVYIQHCLAYNEKLRFLAQADKQIIEDTLMRNPGGMFRWVSCQFESIAKAVRRGTRSSTIRKNLVQTLSSLPETLNGTYERILEQIEEAKQLQDALLLLQCLCFSMRPLRLEELAEVLAIDFESSGGFSEDDRLPDPMEIMIICSSLVRLSEVLDPGGKVDARQTEVSLAHFTVQEYLLESSTHASTFDYDASHARLAKNCLIYLQEVCAKAPLSYTITNDRPFAQYSAEYWWQHMRRIRGSIPIDLILSAEYLVDDDFKRVAWTEIYNMDRPYRTGVYTDDMKRDGSPVYWASLIGIPELVRKLVDKGSDINAKAGARGYALEAAASGGHVEVVGILLDSGADMNALGGSYGSALQAASEWGYQTIVRTLLDRGADPNLHGGASDSSLLKATVGGHVEIVKMLLENGANVNDQSGGLPSPLHEALRRRHNGIAEMLKAKSAIAKPHQLRLNTALKDPRLDQHP